MERVKDSFCQVLKAIGELDMYVSLVRLIRDSKESKAKFCFAEIIDPTIVEAPVVELKNFWHPVLDPQTAVPSNISLGGGNSQNIVITGPNAGGKSTITKSIIISVIMAQTLGVAPAEKMRFTPFAKILTYLNIVDNTAMGKSLFKAAAARAQELWSSVSALAPHQFSITALDELFNGTNNEAAQAAAWVFLEQLADLGTNICVTPTHFDRVTGLAEEHPTKFANYMVPIIRDQNGKAVYTYTLQPGTNKEIIAFEMMNNIGMDQVFIQEAQTNFEETTTP